MGKLKLGDLVKVVKVDPLDVPLAWRVCGKFGLVMETEIHEPSYHDGPVAVVFIDKQKWWLPYEKMEIVGNG